MTDAADTPKDQDKSKPADKKPSLKDIAEKDGVDAKDAKKTDAAKSGGGAASDAQPDANASGDAPKSGGRGFVWFMLMVIVIGGAVAAGWPYVGPKVEPVVGDLRKLMGLAPRPTQATLPSVGETAPPAPAEPSETQTEMTPAPADEAAPAQETLTPVVEDAAPDAEQTADGEAPAVSDEATSAPVDAAPALDALITEIEVLKSRIDALGAMAGDVSGEDAKAALDATAELTRAIAALQGDIQALSTRVQDLEDGAKADPTAPAQALVLASTQVRARLMGDDPFAAELSALESIAGADPVVQAAVQRLRPHAEVGVPTEAALSARFTKVAKDIIAARTAGEADGWLGRVKDGIGGLVTVRRTDPQAISDEVERAVAIGEAALELGDLAGAVKALGELQGAPGEAAAAWLGEARARVEAEAALEDLHIHALAVLSAAGGR